MENQINKQIFLIALLPLMDLFEHKKTILNEEEWLKFVYATQTRVTINPEQFLGKELPGSEVIHKVVDEIFIEYLAKYDVAVA